MRHEVLAVLHVLASFMSTDMSTIPCQASILFCFALFRTHTKERERIKKWKKEKCSLQLTPLNIDNRISAREIQDVHEPTGGLVSFTAILLWNQLAGGVAFLKRSLRNTESHKPLARLLP